MAVKRRPEFSVEEILETGDMKALGEERDVVHEPDAQIVEWDSGATVATPVSSISGFTDRLRAGEMNVLQKNTLDGFNSEFTEGDRRVVYASDPIREVTGDSAMAVIKGINVRRPIDVRPPEDALDVIRKYNSTWAGDIEDQFWNRIENQNVVAPVLYTNQGVVPETGIALMENEDMVAHDTVSSEEIIGREFEADEVIADGIQIEGYEAPESAEATYFVDVMLPDNYDMTGEQIASNGIHVDGDLQDNLPEGLEEIDPRIISDYSENNGVYTLEID